VITAARKKAGSTQKEVAELIRREDGRKVLPPYLNDLEHDRRYPPENVMIEQLAKILRISADVLYFYAKRLPKDVERDADDSQVKRPIALSVKFCRRAAPPTRSVRSDPRDLFADLA
jgi:transcriptional regulator with XRE-family HTH domain